MTSTVPQRHFEIAEPVESSVLHAWLADRSTVLLTPNRRLAAYHAALFEQGQRASGRGAWETPDVLPWSTYVERAWRVSRRDERGAGLTLIGAAQCQILWEQIVRKSAAAENSLLNTMQAARQAVAAWNMARAWHLFPAMQKMPVADDAVLFLEWSDRFLQICREKNYIDAARLPDVLAQSIPAGQPGLPSRLLAIGFDIVTPQQAHLLRRMAEAGVEVRAIAMDTPIGAPPGRTVRREFFSEHDEIRACARWAREQVEQDPTRRVAIVVPDLRRNRSRIIRELTDALDPGERCGRPWGPESAHSEASSAPLFNLSLGQSLADYGLIPDALALIEFSLGKPMPFSQVSSLLRSPFIRGAEREYAARADLDAALRRRAAVRISLTSMRRLLQDHPSLCRLAAHTPEWSALLGEVEDRVTTQQTPHAWSRRFAAIISQWGFPGERPVDSVHHQLMARFRDALDELAALQIVVPRMRGDDALSHLRRIAVDAMFQPEDKSGGKAPIQVLGVLESGGQSFHALWVTGLADDAWPQPARPNPFIPAGLQRSAYVPDACAAASLALDRRITAGWKASSPDVTFSHASREGDGSSEQERSASALILDVPLAEDGAAHGTERESVAVLLQRAGTTAEIADLPLPALADDSRVRGGAALLADQAACPFRAFARHRLGAQPLETPGEGLDAGERGNLLHRVLFLCWSELRDSKALSALDGAGLAEVAGKAVDRALAEAKATGADALAGRFAEVERVRLLRLASQWLEYEKERSEFVVVACEAPLQVVFGSLRMDLRLDRLDRLSDGTHALIDYKTGVAKLSGWLGARPDEPQLPLYFLTSKQEVSALAFARVKRGERGKDFGFEGVSAVENLLPDVAPIETRVRLRHQGYASWDVLTAEWERSLAELAAAFVRGDASVDPKYGELTCARCDLQAVCRVADAGVSAADESIGAGSVQADG